MYRVKISTVGFALLLVLLCGCTTQTGIEETTASMQTGTEQEIVQTTEPEEAESLQFMKDISEAYQTAETTKLSLDEMHSVIDFLGVKGYIAVDSRNQMNMTLSDGVEQFCKSADNQESSEVMILVPDYDRSLTRYDLRTTDGITEMTQRYYQYDGEAYTEASCVDYQIKYQKLTEEGYLMIDAEWNSEMTYVLTLGDMEEHIALRVKPLDETCRTLNRQYILPVGYRENNLFLTDWDETDYGDLDFYDLYDVFYPVVTGSSVPYVSDDNPEVTAIYQIPKDDFEQIIMSYVQIDSQTLQAGTHYLSESETYEYTPRGFYETDYVNVPYPEVTAYQENDDKTVTLTVNAVYPEENSSCLFSHQVTVRLLEDGSFQYVSNKTAYTDYQYQDLWWHEERQTKELQ